MVLDGNTKISIKNGLPVPATIAYRVEKDVYIIAEVSGPLIMVKIRITGSKTFEFIEARSHIHDEPYRSFGTYCNRPETFTIDCYRGVRALEDTYKVAKLVAVSRSGMRKLTASPNFIPYILAQEECVSKSF